MTTSISVSDGRSRSAAVGAIALAAASFLILLLSYSSEPLAPLRLLSLALAFFAAWSFCDELGMSQPLNRAGLVFFAIAAGAKVQVVLGVAPGVAGRYYLLYAGFVLAAVLFWSVTLLHRQRTVRVIGAVGVVATLAPIVALVVGHLVVGTGAFLGVEAILSATQGAAPTNLGFVTLIERVFGLWGFFAASLLWRGDIRPASQRREA
jgi:hypothetical protein